MSIETLKQHAAEAALEYIVQDAILGVGFGSTVAHFIASLGPYKHRIQAAVAASPVSESALKAMGIPIIPIEDVSELPIYIDGADEVLRTGQMIKGGGAALTREKILAHLADKFICIVDERKLVNRLGETFPIPIEVLPMARSLVGREIVKLGGTPVLRENVQTDNGNIIIDAHHLITDEPLTLEAALSQIPGVLTAGVFAKDIAHTILVARASGEIERIEV